MGYFREIIFNLGLLFEEVIVSYIVNSVYPDHIHMFNP